VELRILDAIEMWSLRMDAIRDEYLATSARSEGLSARQIVRHLQYCIESLARPAHRRLFWGPVWLVGEAPKRSHVAACQSFSRLARVWNGLRLQAPVEFRDLTDQPMPKSHNRWGDMRPRRIDAALGARKLMRDAIGLSGTATSDLCLVLLGSTVREAFGAQRLDLYRWYALPRCENVRGELFVATIPHPSPLASRVFDERRVARLLGEVQYARVRRPTPARGSMYIDGLGLVALEE
jgi:hypothetical protein